MLIQYSKCWEVSSSVVSRIEKTPAPPLSMPIATSCAAPANTMLDKPWPCRGVRLASMAMEPAKSPQGAVARDSGMIATAPRRNALRGMSELDITLYNQIKTTDCASLDDAWLEQSCALADHSPAVLPFICQTLDSARGWQHASAAFHSLRSQPHELRRY